MTKHDPNKPRKYDFQSSQDILSKFPSINGLHDISFLQPEYNLSSQSNITNLMLAHLSRFNLLRFMQWTNTNENFEVNWNDTTPVDWPRYTTPKYNPWHTIPYLINQFNTSIDA